MMAFSFSYFPTCSPSSLPAFFPFSFDRLLSIRLTVMTGGSTGWNDGDTLKAEVVDLGKFIPGFPLRRVVRSKNSPSSKSDSDELEKSSVSSASNEVMCEVPMRGVASSTFLLTRNSSSSSRLNFRVVLEDTVSD